MWRWRSRHGCWGRAGMRSASISRRPGRHSGGRRRTTIRHEGGYSFCNATRFGWAIECQDAADWTGNLVDDWHRLREARDRWAEGGPASHRHVGELPERGCYRSRYRSVECASRRALSRVEALSCKLILNARSARVATSSTRRPWNRLSRSLHAAFSGPLHGCSARSLAGNASNAIRGSCPIDWCLQLSSAGSEELGGRGLR
mmetsp:Transcript_2289/g.7332  ORF Transcript_2289/g.7332 Transcript_2289/m.7332 type:complete len:202 (+) Transcript_2289:570-1175(+)